MNRLNSRNESGALVFKAFAACSALVAFGLCGTVAAQTVYRIVGADGRVTFSDQPPVSGANVTATGRNGKQLELGNSNLPFELRQVVTRYPVSLYTASNCAPCNTGRALLTSRGVPFTERTVNTNEDIEALARLAGENSLPFLTIGGQKIKGFSDTEWAQFLDAAGYPTSSKLPSGYRNAPAFPLVIVQKPEPAPASASTAAAGSQTARAGGAAERPPAPAAASNPAGIKF